MRRTTDRIKPLLILAMVLGLAPISSADEPSQEYKVKAAFLFNFARFVEWPAGAFTSDDAPFVFAVVGRDPFNGALDAAIAGKKIGSRRLEVRHFDSVDKIGPCQILFVPATDDGTESPIIHRVENNHVLTVGESDNFTASGGIFRFFTEDNKMRFEVRTDAADRAQLKISSKLLKLARIYKQ